MCPRCPPHSHLQLEQETHVLTGLKGPDWSSVPTKSTHTHTHSFGFDQTTPTVEDHIVLPALIDGSTHT